MQQIDRTDCNIVPWVTVAQAQAIHDAVAQGNNPPVPHSFQFLRDLVLNPMVCCHYDGVDAGAQAAISVRLDNVFTGIANKRCRACGGVGHEW